MLAVEVARMASLAPTQHQVHQVRAKGGDVAEVVAVVVAGVGEEELQPLEWAPPLKLPQAPPPPLGLALPIPLRSTK